MISDPTCTKEHLNLKTLDTKKADNLRLILLNNVSEGAPKVMPFGEIRRIKIY